MTSKNNGGQSRTGEQWATDVVLASVLIIFIVALIVVPDAREGLLILAGKFGEGASMVLG